MDGEKLVAVKESIAHWERMRDGKRIKINGGAYEYPSAKHCPLCARYHPSADVHVQMACFGCPVRERTGLPFCDDSPYNEAFDAACKFGMDSPEFKEGAAYEVEFLKSLLPE